MEREQIKEKIMGLIRDIIDDEVEITEESGLMEDLELSSLEIITMVADIEQEFQVDLNAVDIRKIVSVGDLIDSILS